MAFATANKSECKTSETEKKDLPKPDCGMWKLVRENEDTGRKCVASKITVTNGILSQQVRSHI